MRRSQAHASEERVYQFKVREWVLFKGKPYSVMSRLYCSAYGYSYYRLRFLNQEVVEDDLISEAVYNSPLYKALL